MTAQPPSRLFRSAVAALGLLLLAPASAVPAAEPATAPIPPELAGLDKNDLLAWPHALRPLAFRNADKFLPFKTVKAGGPVYPLPEGKPIAPVFTHGGKSYDVDTFMKANFMSGLLVIQDGEIRLEKYALGRTAADRWMSFSVAKSVTSTLVGAALRDGFIKSLDDPMSAYIPELKGGIYDRISIRHTLMMASGAKWNEDYRDPENDIHSMSETSYVDNMKDRPLVSPPGEKFLYRTGDSNLLGVLVARATGKPTSQYLSEKIWRPFGMENDAYWQTHMGEELGGANLQITLRDYGRFGLFFLHGGVAGGKPVVPDGWTKEAGKALLPTGWGDIGYGYQWWVHSDGSFMGLGIYGQTLYLNPATNTVIVMNSAWPEADWEPGYALEEEFYKAVAKAIGG